MHLIVYTSEVVAGMGHIDHVLADIVGKAKLNNPRLGITGLLFYHNGRFLQIIEGRKDALERLMAAIEKDPRHRNMERLVDESIYQRSFEQWNMDSLNLSDSQAINIRELRSIRDAFLKTMKADTGMLAYFYKTMLEAIE